MVLVLSLVHVKDGWILLVTIPWALSDIIRYTYYIQKLFKKNFYIIEYIRYTAFIILYPIGYLGEIINTLRRIN